MELPAELLVKIVGYTDGKTVHSMLRTNKRINAICNRNQRDLPKCVVELEIEHDDHRENLILTVTIWPREQKKMRRFVATLVRDRCYYTEEQKRERVAEFYEENAEAHVAGTEETFPIGLMAGLGMHLDYILMKVDFSLLRLENLTVEQIAMVYRHLQVNQSKVGRMILSSIFRADLPLESMPPANIFNGLTIRNPPEGFYQLPSIHELSSLAVLWHYHRVVLHDDELWQLKVPKIIIDEGGCDITERGICTFITQWSRSKREIDSVELVCEDEAIEDEDEKWRRVALSLDPRLVRVGGYVDKSQSNYVSLTRLADNVKLQFCWFPEFHSCIDIRRVPSSAEPDLEYPL